MKIQRLDDKGLRKFGISTGAIIVVLFAVFFPWLLDAQRMPIWPWILAGLLWAPAILIPNSLAPVYAIWMKVGHVLGWINTRIILGVLFYVLVLPMGLMMRIFSNDPMARKSDPSASSYRVKSIDVPKDRLEKPY